MREKRVKDHRDSAIKHIDLMRQAIEHGDYKKAMHHKKIADVETDQMLKASEMIEKDRS
jgi:hypothetical protein